MTDSGVELNLATPPPEAQGHAVIVSLELNLSGVAASTSMLAVGSVSLSNAVTNIAHGTATLDSVRSLCVLCERLTLGHNADVGAEVSRIISQLEAAILALSSGPATGAVAATALAATALAAAAPAAAVGQRLAAPAAVGAKTASTYSWNITDCSSCSRVGHVSCSSRCGHQTCRDSSSAQLSVPALLYSVTGGMSTSHTI